MDTYKNKYNKYKNKYLALKYGGTGVSEQKLDEKQNIKYSLEIKRINLSLEKIKNQYTDEKIKDFEITNFKITKNFKISNIPDQLNKKCILNEKNDKYDKCKNFNEKDLKSLLENLIKQYNDKYTISSEKKYVQKIISKKNEKFIIIGDIHCDLVNFKLILENLIKEGIINDNFKIIEENYKIIFLGDMVDYGLYGIETVMIILLLKNKNFDNVYIISGNHEQSDLYSEYHLGQEIKTEITEEKSFKGKFESFFNLLPVAIFLKYNNDKKYYQFCHGGVPYEYINNFDFNFKKFLIYDHNKTYILDDYLSEQFLWNDFTNDNSSKLEIDRKQICSKDISIYLEKYNIYSIISGHQDLASLSFQILKEEEKYRNSHIYNDEDVGKLSELKNNNSITLDPTKDFLSIITSNAVKKISKYIISDVDWILRIKEDIKSEEKQYKDFVNKELDRIVKFFNIKQIDFENDISKKIEYILNYINTKILKNVTPNYLVLSQNILE